MLDVAAPRADIRGHRQSVPPVRRLGGQLRSPPLQGQVGLYSQGPVDEKVAPLGLHSTKAHKHKYRAKRSNLRVLPLSLTLVACLTAGNATAGPHFTAFAGPTQRLFIDNINLTAQDFFAAYMSDAVEERRYAELYLLGVLDATEGIGWCDYRTFKTTTLGEALLSGFKALEPVGLKTRAAHVIADILARRFPCRSK
jgi:hypothetical protein